MEYTVKKLAQVSGVSGRTLRYYDQIGLLKPARINTSGYRIYGQKQVDQLQQILFYRELEINLGDIKDIMGKPDFDETAALKKHYSKLIEKRTRLDDLLATVEKTIASKEGGNAMQDKEKFEGFKEKLIDENEQKYGKEIREKYGDDTVDQSNSKLMGLTKEEYRKMTGLEQEVISMLKEAYQTGDPASDRGQDLAKLHKEWLMYSWSSYSKDAHAGLAEMYVADERFTAYYDKHVKGGAAFLRDAVLVYTGKK
ncbi:MerR family transcriptional regulator [Virgibacillus ainsalahensis]